MTLEQSVKEQMRFAECAKHYSKPFKLEEHTQGKTLEIVGMACTLPGNDCKYQVNRNLNTYCLYLLGIYIANKR